MGRLLVSIQAPTVYAVGGGVGEGGGGQCPKSAPLQTRKGAPSLKIGTSVAVLPPMLLGCSSAHKE